LKSKLKPVGYFSACGAREKPKQSLIGTTPAASAKKATSTLSSKAEFLLPNLVTSYQLLVTAPDGL
jgi:hypothetical protein